MPLSLRDALVPGWLQVTASVRALVDKAESWCEENGQPASALIGAKLAPDMLPFAYQVKCCWTHSAHAIDGARKGHFVPHMDPPPDSFDGLRALLDSSKGELEAIDDAELETLAANDMIFTIGDKFRLDFTVQTFLLGFSQPNFYFHAATAYDILRMKGLAIGKRDYLGKLPVKG
jgi:hypothetical protein